MSKTTKLGLERSTFAADDGLEIGRDPRKISADEWRQIKRTFPVGLAAIRAKCLDCAIFPGEVRRCVYIDCPLWPLRMGVVPKGYREARRQIDDDD